jgi:AcrR family transcriptional regulator
MPTLTHEDITKKKETILAAARELFATKGYEETTIAEIARAAGVAVGTVYLYFGNKHEILIEVCLAVNAVIAQVIQSPQIASLPLRQIPRTIIEESFRLGREQKRFMKLYQVGAYSPEEAERFKKGKQVITDALDAFFRQIVAQGLLPPFNTAAYAELTNDLVSSSLQQCFAIEDGARENFFREGVIEMIERLFFGPPLTSTTGDTQQNNDREE